MSLHLITSTLISHLWSWYISAFFSFETIQFCVLFCRNFSIRILNCEYDREIIHEIDWNFEQALFHELIIHLFISEKVFFRIFSNDCYEKPLGGMGRPFGAWKEGVLRGYIMYLRSFHGASRLKNTRHIIHSMMIG